MSSLWTSHGHRSTVHFMSKEEKRLTFWEQASQEGAARIASLSTVERTQRAMLAEATEDRVTALEDQLEVLLEDVGTPKEKYEVIVKEIQVLKSQYEELVGGRPSAVLETMQNSLKCDSG